MNQTLLRKFIGPIIAIMVLLLAIAWMAGMFSDKIAPDTVAPGAQPATNNWPVTLTTVAKQESAVASLKARETTLISSRIMARIDKMLVRAGDQVSRGDLLIKLENSDLLSQLDQAKARINSASGSLTEAQNALQRMQNLKQQGLASNADLDKAQANYTRADSELQAAQQAKNEAEAALSYSEIRAPINGRIVDRSAEPGNMATPGQTLLALYNPQSLLVEANVREALAIALSLGQQLSVTIDSLHLQIPASIIELVPAADPNSRSFIVKAEIAFSEQLRPGMFARLSLPVGEEQRILIPREYVQSFGQLDRVWVVQQGQLSRRFVRLGEVYDDAIEVVSGLSAGEIITLPIN